MVNDLYSSLLQFLIDLDYQQLRNIYLQLMEKLGLELFPPKRLVVEAIHKEEDAIRNQITVDKDRKRAWISIEWKLRELLRNPQIRAALRFGDSKEFTGQTIQRDDITYSIPGTLRLLDLGDARAHTRQVPMQTILGIAIENLEFLSASVRWFMTIVIFDALDHYEFLDR